MYTMYNNIGIYYVYMYNIFILYIYIYIYSKLNTFTMLFLGPDMK